MLKKLFVILKLYVYYFLTYTYYEDRESYVKSKKVGIEVFVELSVLRLLCLQSGFRNDVSVVTVLYNQNLVCEHMLTIFRNFLISFLIIQNFGTPVTTQNSDFLKIGFRCFV